MRQVNALPLALQQVPLALQHALPHAEVASFAAAAAPHIAAAVPHIATAMPRADVAMAHLAAVQQDAMSGAMLSATRRRRRLPSFSAPAPTPFSMTSPRNS
jgi:hypothetical protein